MFCRGTSLVDRAAVLNVNHLHNTHIGQFETNRGIDAVFDFIHQLHRAAASSPELFDDRRGIVLAREQERVHTRRHARGDFRDQVLVDRPWAAGHGGHQPEHVRARLDGGAGLLKAGDAADLDSHWEQEREGVEARSGKDGGKHRARKKPDESRRAWSKIGSNDYCFSVSAAAAGAGVDSPGTSMFLRPRRRSRRRRLLPTRSRR